MKKESSSGEQVYEYFKGTLCRSDGEKKYLDKALAYDATRKWVSEQDGWEYKHWQQIVRRKDVLENLNERYNRSS